MAQWAIKGEAGAGLNAAVRNVEDLGLTQAEIEFNALEPDLFTFEMPLIDNAGNSLDGAYHIPDVGQRVEVYKDGNRKFRGWCLLPKIVDGAVRVTVVGPGYFLFKDPLMSQRQGERDTATGANGQRPSYVFPTQGLRTSLVALNNAAVAAGVPMTTIADADIPDRMDATYNVPKTTLTGKSWGDGFTEMLQWCPDAVPWFYHEGAANPDLMLTRRGGAATMTLTRGTLMTRCEISPRIDLEVKRVELHYVTRNPATGKPRWARQHAGLAADNPAVLHKLQILPISGQDTADLVPPDDFDSVRLRTKAANFTSADVFKYDTVLKDAADRLGAFKGTLPTINNPGWHVILTGETGEFMRKDYGLKRRNLRVSQWVTGTYLSAGGLGGCAGYLRSIGRLNWDIGGSGGTNTFRLLVDFNVEAINLSYPKLTNVYKKWAFDYLTPPASLAENLKDAQTWVPWEGTVEIVGDEVTGDNHLNRKLRIANSLPEHATMDALLRSVKHDILNKRTTFTLGAPARLDFGSLMSRVKRQPADNIVYL